MVALTLLNVAKCAGTIAHLALKQKWAEEALRLLRFIAWS
jgi:hypothetical protein